MKNFHFRKGATSRWGEYLRVMQTAYASGSPHIVYISSLGVVRTAYFYYQGKYETGLLIEQGPLPWTIVRTTQFHPFVLQIIRSRGADTLPEVPVPAGVRFQSIDVDEVADRLVSFMELGPAGHAPDMGGPQVLPVEEMIEAYLRFQGTGSMHSGQGLTWHRIMQLAPSPGKRFCTTFMKVAEIQLIAVFATCTHLDQVELEFA